MKQPTLLLLAGLATLSFAPAAPGAAAARPAPGPIGKAESEVRAAVAALASAFERGDAEAAVALTSRDLHLIHPRRGEVGHDDYVAALRAGMRPDPARRVAAKLDHVHVEGRLAVVGITWNSTVRAPDGAMTSRGERDQEVWRRESDGRWRLFRGASFPIPAPSG